MPKSSKSDQIVRELQGDIQSRAIQPGSFLPTERELQERFDVSRTTIRRAMADLATIGWAKSVPNRGMVAVAAGPLPKTNGSTQVAFIDHTSCLHTSLFIALSQRLGRDGISLVHVDSTEGGTTAALERAAESDFLGAFVWPKNAFTDPALISAVQARMPVIAVDHGLDGISTDLVMADHQQGAFQAVSHLIELGRKRIAITGYLTHHHDCHLRLAGYAEAHFKHGLAPVSQNLAFTSTYATEAEDTRLLRWRMREDDRPDAIFVMHDMSVPAIVSGVLEENLHIPNDVAIVGFGNDLPLVIEDVGLTTVSIDWNGVAEELASVLSHRLAHPRSQYETRLVPTHLVVRGSCGAAPNTWSHEPYQVSSITTTTRLASAARFCSKGKARVGHS